MPHIYTGTYTHHQGLKPQWPYGFARTDVELGRHGEPKDTEPHPERFLPEEKRADALLRAQQQQKQRGASPAAAAH